MEHLTHDHDGHSHEHAHDHGHPHSHAHGEAVSGEQAVALLQYMLDHNIHHAAELSDLAGQFSGEVAHQLLHAVESLRPGQRLSFRRPGAAEEVTPKRSVFHVSFHYL